MCYARSYKPVYTSSKEEVVNNIRESIKKEWWAIMHNPQPVDLRWDDSIKQMRPCKAKHETIFFDSNFKDRSTIWDMFAITWHYCREVPEEEKTIQEIRHFHAVLFLWWKDA